MALPRLNENVKYTMVIPSTGKEVEYRPYLVKEEKVMLIALESGDNKQMMMSVSDTIQSCLIDSDIVVRKLPMFDIEYMFLQIRSKAVGESTKLNLSCESESCENVDEINVKFSSIKAPVVKHKKGSVIELTDKISLQMKYPSYNELINISVSEAKADVNTAFEMVISCVDFIIMDDEKISLDDISKDEINDFIDQFTVEQFGKVQKYVTDMPTLTHDITWTCSLCEHKNSLTLKGTADFFQ